MPVDIEQYRKKFVIRTDQLNGEDLLTGPVDVDIVDVVNGKTDFGSLDVKLSDGYKPWRPCNTMQKLMHFIWDTGIDPNQWMGKRVRLYYDPDVKYGGDTVGGIRLSHATGIDRPMSVKLTETRGKKKVWTVEPLKTAKPEPRDPTLLDVWRPRFKGQSKEVLTIAKTIGEAYTKRNIDTLEAVFDDISLIGDEAAHHKLMEFYNAVNSVLVEGEGATA